MSRYLVFDAAVDGIERSIAATADLLSATQDEPAGKLQLATVISAAMTLGLLVPEAGSIALPGNAEGEITDAGLSLRSAVAIGCLRHSGVRCSNFRAI